MRIHWTDTALGHLSAIRDYVAQDAPIYARALVDRLTSRSRQIGRFPRSGRMVPEFEQEDVHEVIEPPHRIIYCILPDRVDVLAVVHSSQEKLRLR